MFSGIESKLDSWLHGQGKSISIKGLCAEHWFLLFQDFVKQREAELGQKDLLFITQSESSAEDVCATLKDFFPQKTLILPGLDVPIYSGLLASEQSFVERWKTLDTLHSHKSQKIIVCSIESFLLKNPPVDFFQENALLLKVSDILSPDELAFKLVQLGYSHNITVEERGSFTQKGEIFDIYPLNGRPFRIHYFDEMIEEIFSIDPLTNRTLKDRKLEEVLIGPFTKILTNEPFSITLRSNIPRPKPGEKTKFELRNEIFSKLSNNQLFENYPIYSSLFFEESSSILDYLASDPIISFIDDDHISRNTADLFEKLRSDFEYVSNEEESLLPHHDKVYFDNSFLESLTNKIIKLDTLGISIHPEEQLKNVIDISAVDFNNFQTNYLGLINPKKEDRIKGLINHLEKLTQIIVTYSNEENRKEFEHLLEVFNIDSSIKRKITFLHSNLSTGFYYIPEKTLVVSTLEIFKRKAKRSTQKRAKSVDLFAEQIASLKTGDFVIHANHGLGKYMGMETIDRAGIKTDFLVIHYENADKVYVPVYKINLIQKHADSNAQLKLNNLRTNKFQQAKSKAKESVKKLAFDLLKLQAERETSKSYAFSPPDDLFHDFETAFSFKETPDQQNAIDSVIKDMQRLRPMDHLVCGDVGFGKTEVAMRAAFKAVLDNKQVSVLVPTTVLALQHYHSFRNRFKNFPVTVEYLSRFRTPKDAREVIAKLESGDVDIVIGTHKLLSDKIKYHDLGLVIVDEEHRFGVSHKEKLKLLKSTVDFLTLTATPIPRTLHMAYLGLRDLSLIRTAPPKRQSIKTYIMKEDEKVIKEAIEKELGRGGQVFIIHNKVLDIEQYVAKIRSLVPKASIVYAHGQLPEKDLEKRMAEFYNGKFQVLISTTIVESGIDIPNANTMIIDRADTFGLAQLHQLRGRIGRSDKKAYAYFIVPKTGKLTDVAQKRLKALSDYANKGSGFAIASCDLEIRGAGDLLGGQQSGHMDSIGLELYTDLLKDAIQEIKGEKQLNNKDLEIMTPFPAYIPNTFIGHNGERLKYYKALSNAHSLDELDEKLSELEDVFGPIPKELKNLENIIESRIHLGNTGVKQLQASNKMVTLKFDKKILEQNTELRDKIIETFINQPKSYTFSPNFTLTYTHKHDIDPESLVNICKEIAGKIVPC